MLYIATYENTLKAKGYLENAVEALNASVFDIAIEQFRHAEKLDPTNYHLWLGYVYIRARIALLSSKEAAPYKNMVKEHIPKDDIFKAIRFVAAEKNLNKQSRYYILLNLLAASSILKSTDSQILAARELAKLAGSNLNEKTDLSTVIQSVRPLIPYRSDQELAVSLERVQQFVVDTYKHGIDEIKFSIKSVLLDEGTLENTVIQENREKLAELNSTVSVLFEPDQTDYFSRVKEPLARLEEEREHLWGIQERYRNLQSKSYELFGTYIWSQDDRADRIQTLDAYFIIWLVAWTLVMGIVWYLFSAFRVSAIFIYGVVALLSLIIWFYRRITLGKKMLLYLNEYEPVSKESRNLAGAYSTKVEQIFDEQWYCDEEES
jgi:uncharacterized membrane protein